MKALVLRDYKNLVFEDMPTPQPGVGEVAIAVKACGICGSDVHGMDGSTGRRRPPIIMGHEAAGIIADVGSGRSKWKIGDRVTFDSTIYCGKCEYCKRGEINLCDHRRVLGVSCEDYRQHGAFAERVVVPERVLYHVPPKVSFEQAALVEPFSIALHAVKRANPRPGDSCVVIGAGMIGQALAQCLKQAGCAQVIVVDVAVQRLNLASSLGATHTIDSSKSNPLEIIRELTETRGVDSAYEAVGISATVETAIRSVRKGGSVVLVGNVAPKIDFPLQAAVTRELNIYGSCASRGEYEECLQLMQNGVFQTAPLISAEAPLSDGAEWFARLYKKEPGLLKVMLQP
jgi:L-iditol 2-dehydrogenase